MQCPVDGATLSRSARSGVEIDHCPTCRGVWLDRDELDKILALERAGDPGEEAGAWPRDPSRDAQEAAGREPEAVPHGDDRRPYGDKLGEWQARDEAAHRSRLRRGVLGDLFDF